MYEDKGQSVPESRRSTSSLHSYRSFQTGPSNMAMDVPRPEEDSEFKARLAELEKMPLFMKELPDDPNDPTIAAIQSLLYEGPPDG